MIYPVVSGKNNGPDTISDHYLHRFLKINCDTTSAGINSCTSRDSYSPAVKKTGDIFRLLEHNISEEASWLTTALNHNQYHWGVNVSPSKQCDSNCPCAIIQIQELGGSQLSYPVIILPCSPLHQFVWWWLKCPLQQPCLSFGMPGSCLLDAPLAS